MQKNISIKVQGLSKEYELGAIGSASLRETLSSLWKPRPQSEKFWALKDLSFQVEQGEVIGIIGHNGAGKSTLLKLLSRITEPTRGSIELRGRMASLLEVGTGFHPELSGLENIYLNGSILGMRRQEIKAKLDEIIDFSGVERFLHTPVKRYSSGMYVRLAFSVAAHLEPEILIVDEVLSVGDVAFQKRCLGKMEDVSKGHGRSVLFVSHSMSSIERLCSKSMLLEQGQMQYFGSTPEAVARYMSRGEELSQQNLRLRKDRKGAGLLRFTALQLRNEAEEELRVAMSGKMLRLRLYYEQTGPAQRLRYGRIGLALKRQGNPLLILSSEMVQQEPLEIQSPKGYIEFILPKCGLTRGQYSTTVFAEFNREVQDWLDNAGNIEVEDGDFYGTGRNYPQGWEGRTVLTEFSLQQKESFS